MKKVAVILSGLIGLGVLTASAQDNTNGKEINDFSLTNPTFKTYNTSNLDSSNFAVLQPRRRVYRNDGYGNNNNHRSNYSYFSKGYIGANIGAAIAVGDFSNNDYGGGAKTGFHVNILNLGYLISPNVGLSGDFFYGRNPYNTTNVAYGNWNYIGATAGLLFTAHISPEVDWDFTPQIGFLSANSPTYYDGGSANSSAFAYKLGTQLRFNLSPEFAFTVNFDYLSSKPDFNYPNANIRVQQTISNIALGGGFVYRLR